MEVLPIETEEHAQVSQLKGYRAYRMFDAQSFQTNLPFQQDMLCTQSNAQTKSKVVHHYTIFAGFYTCLSLFSGGECYSPVPVPAMSPRDHGCEIVPRSKRGILPRGIHQGAQPIWQMSPFGVIAGHHKRYCYKVVPQVKRVCKYQARICGCFWSLYLLDELITR